MTSTTITQPATTRVSVRARPSRLAAIGKLIGMVVAVGTVVAVVVAAGVGLAAIVVTNATG